MVDCKQWPGVGDVWSAGEEDQQRKRGQHQYIQETLSTVVLVNGGGGSIKSALTLNQPLCSCDTKVG